MDAGRDRVDLRLRDFGGASGRLSNVVFLVLSNWSNSFLLLKFFFLCAARESIDLIILRPENQDLGDKDLSRPLPPKKQIVGLSISVILSHSSRQSV